MRNLLLGAALLATSSTPALSEVTFEIDNFFVDSGITTVIMAITNEQIYPVTSVFVSCAFLDREMKAIDIGRGLISQIGAGERVYEKVQIGQTERVQHADCRIDKYRD